MRKIILREYQNQITSDGIEILNEYKLLYLSMMVRTGKTITALAIAERYFAKSVLFLTKKKAIPSIQKDYETLRPDFKITITNYEAINKINNNYDYDFIILDECHCLGAFPKPSKKTMLLKKLCAGKPIIYLSGTPTPESYSQIFHQFYVSSFSPFANERSFYSWAAKYVTLGKKYFFNKQINDYSNAKKELIDEKINHLFISFTQIEAGFEMPVTEHILNVEMKESTYLLADRLKKEKVIIAKNGSEIMADTEVKMMNKLHQIYSGTVLDEQGNMNTFDDSKIVFIKEYFKDKKIAIFYKYRAEEVLIKEHFKNFTSSPEDFNANDGLTFISQIQSGREGINLSTADCLVMYNLDFSAVSYFQVRARLQYKDRIKEALVYWIFSNRGIENKIYNAVKQKRNYTTSYFRKDFSIERVRTPKEDPKEIIS